VASDPHRTGAAVGRPKPPLALPGMRIGLLGGSFNPAHRGHRHISLAAMERLGLDRLWWVVTPGNPLKSNGELASLEERARLARAVARHPQIVVTEFEAALPSRFTADTVAFLRKRFPGVHFVWVMGGDNLVQFHRWRDWRRIFAAMPVAVVDRPGMRHKALASPAALNFARARISEADAGKLALMRPPAWTYLSIRLTAASSTAIRKSRKSSP
jgi:nicotinate-nucleotide adenylyltransferase